MHLKEGEKEGKMDPTRRTVTEREFADALLEKLGQYYERALTVYQQIGSYKKEWADKIFSIFKQVDITNVELVLSELEKHWRSHLLYKPIQQIEVMGDDPTEWLLQQLFRTSE